MVAAGSLEKVDFDPKQNHLPTGGFLRSAILPSIVRAFLFLEFDMAHKRGVDRDPREVFLGELSRHGSVRKACQVSGLSRGEVRALMRDDEDFAQEYADAMEDSVDRIEEAGTNLARNGDDKLIKLFLEVKRYKKSVDVELTEIKPSINITIGTKK